MIYLNDSHIGEMGVDWRELAGTIRQVLRLYGTEEVAQPLKPYLRFRDPANRIIAMPAFVGGEVEACGIKWIASYPGNPARGLPRAHNTIVLNDPATGEPAACFRSNALNALRTAAVSGVMLDAWAAWRGTPSFSAGIVGFGPIGRAHLEMLDSLFGERLETVRLFDPRGVDLQDFDADMRARTFVCRDWREIYDRSDVFITCTTARERYIDRSPRPGALLLNVSLRDYVPDAVKDVNAVVVDDWTEVCRENTDIERLHLLHGWTRERAVTLKEAVIGGGLARFVPGEPVFFNPMGLAAFDIGVAAHYGRKALQTGVGVRL